LAPGFLTASDSTAPGCAAVARSSTRFLIVASIHEPSTTTVVTDPHRQLLGIQLVAGEDGEVMMIGGRFDERKLDAIVLLGASFGRNEVGFVRSLEVTSELARRRTGYGDPEWFQLRDVIRLPGGGRSALVGNPVSRRHADPRRARSH
jgi:hypothetical protein